MLTKDNIQINFDVPDTFVDENLYVRDRNSRITHHFANITKLVDDSESSKYAHLFTNAELVREVMSVTCEINKVIISLKQHNCNLSSPYVHLSLRYYSYELLGCAIRLEHIYKDMELADCFLDDTLSKRYESLWNSYSKDFADEEHEMMSFEEIKNRLRIRNEQNDTLATDLYKTIIKALHCQWFLTSDYYSEMTSAESCKQVIERAAREYFRNNIERETRLLCKQAIGLKRSAELTTEHWLIMRETEEEAFDLATKLKLRRNKKYNLKGYDEEFRNKLEDNTLMIYDLREFIYYNELFCFDKALDDDSDLLESITFKNLNLFFRLVLRCNIIRCNLCPNLRPEFDAWIEGDDGTDTSKIEKKSHQDVYRLSDKDTFILEEVKGYLSKGEWIKPATAKNIKDWVEVLFGKRPNQLDKEDRKNSVEFREFFTSGRKGKYTSRAQVSTANIVGYLMDCEYLPNSPKQLSKVFFGEENNDNNINKGREGNRSAAFEKLIPLMDKYRLRIIEKHN